MRGREFKRLVGAHIPDDAIVEISIMVTDLDPEVDKEVEEWYEINGIEESNVTKAVWLIKAGKITRG